MNVQIDFTTLGCSCPFRVLYTRETPRQQHQKKKQQQQLKTATTQCRGK